MGDSFADSAAFRTRLGTPVIKGEDKKDRRECVDTGIDNPDNFLAVSLTLAGTEIIDSSN